MCRHGKSGEGAKRQKFILGKRRYFGMMDDGSLIEVADDGRFERRGHYTITSIRVDTGDPVVTVESFRCPTCGSKTCGGC